MTTASRSIGELKRALEATSQAIDALDADVAAGRMAADEHARQRAEREREAGRLYVELRRAQRDTRAQGVDPAAPPSPTPQPGWRASPALIVAAAVLLVVVGVGAGLLFERGLSGSGARAAAPASATGTARPLTAAMNEIDLQALRLAASREDAPTDSLLRLAHVALDEGRLDEARPLYARVLAREPRNVEAITHVGAILYQEGRVDAALAKVDEALRIDPRYIHAHWDRTQYFYQAKRDYPAAIKAGEAFLAIVPDGPDAESVRRLIADARRAAGSAPRPAR